MLTQDKFEELVKDLVESSVEPCQKALWDAKLQPTDIDKVILVGGQTRSPIITRTVTEVFGKEPSAEINPDEVVAMGAAIQGGVLTGDVKDIVLLDVLPLSLGLETRGGLFVKLISRNSTIPLKNTMTFTTVVDNQQSVEIHILQGEREISQREPQPCEIRAGRHSAGAARRAADRGFVRGRRQRHRQCFGQGQDDRARTGDADHAFVRPCARRDRALIMEAETSIDKDRRAKELILQKNRLDSLIKNARRAMSEFGKSFPLEEQQEINGILNEAEEVLSRTTRMRCRKRLCRSKRGQPDNRGDVDDGLRVES